MLQPWDGYQSTRNLAPDPDRHMPARRRNTSSNSQISDQRGFTLIEVLVSVVVLSIGLLGLAALQSTGLRNNHSAYYRSQATFLAYDIIDRMRANRSVAKAGNYNLTMDATPAGGSSVAANDQVAWTNSLDDLLPSGDGSITVDTATGATTVIVQWDDQRAGGSTTQRFTVQTQL